MCRNKLAGIVNCQHCVVGMRSCLYHGVCTFVCLRDADSDAGGGGGETRAGKSTKMSVKDISYCAFLPISERHYAYAWLSPFLLHLPPHTSPSPNHVGVSFYCGLCIRLLIVARQIPFGSAHFPTNTKSFGCISPQPWSSNAARFYPLPIKLHACCVRLLWCHMHFIPPFADL